MQIVCQCGCGRNIKNPRRNQRFYSAACRARKWREDHIPHCPGCGTALEIQVEGLPQSGPMPRANGKEEP